jgi:hypothetical protein
MSEAEIFQKRLGQKLEDLFVGKFRFYKSKLQLRRKYEGGNDVIVLSGSNKWSPYISVAFYFGKHFDVVRRIEKKFNEHSMPYHIQQYSLNAKLMKELTYTGEYTWNVDITKSHPDLASEVKKAIEGIEYPFFDRFSSLETAREALSSNDPWCFDARGPFWSSLLKVDAALGDLEHFRQWIQCLEPFYLKQARIRLMEYSVVLDKKSNKSL